LIEDFIDKGVPQTSVGRFQNFIGCLDRLGWLPVNLLFGLVVEPKKRGVPLEELGVDDGGVLSQCLQTFLSDPYATSLRTVNESRLLEICLRPADPICDDGLLSAGQDLLPFFLAETNLIGKLFGHVPNGVLCAIGDRLE
jgi:hypothetical protein